MTQKDFKEPILRATRRVVVKIGSQILSSGAAIEKARLRGLIRELSALHDQKKEIVIVSSGAVAAGMSRLGWKERPRTIPEKQALAAVGQIKLMALYERYFSKFKKSVAQVLLTHEDLANRQRYLNAKHTFEMLLEASIIPIVNENDTVAVEEMKFGDNDHLSALAATLLGADLLVILSDVEGVYDRDPRIHRAARIIPLMDNIKHVKEAIVGESRSALGTGGIVTKIGAAEEAAAAGIATVITSGVRPGALTRVFDASQEIGTLVLPEQNRLTHRKHWIAYNLKPAGDIVVDGGAYEALVHQKKSLLPSGLKEVRGAFGAGDCVRCLDPGGREFARGLVSYSAQELNRIKGLHTSNIEKVLGYKSYDEIIHRDDLVLFEKGRVME
ncbi:MAG TPA: glutamate 5-kinase [Candidatus Binatia bacterium]|nr:glutamate 5-kinase [Candidatus Binatia bacterium]